MKIAVPINEDRNTICVSFGRAPEFLFLDSETNERNFIKNEAADSQGGAGVLAAQIIVDNNVEVLITPRCGENAGKVLNEADINVYKSTSSNLDDEINKFTSGRLEKLTKFSAGFHNSDFGNY